ncbi:MAG: SMI1/KNR4 family protein [Lawsonibacter sp.]|nr:SMI1/KNR4 family protein [Lawsonibacter sp.]
MSAAKDLARAYYDGLKEAYSSCDGQEIWDHFASVAQGASQEDIDRLLELYPDAPESLIELLRLVDGTYYREYPEGNVLLYFLGSDYEDYPYYLLSARQMVETKDNFASWGDYLINREYDDEPVDEGICDDMDKLNFLHFSDCCNNGGTSQLFIDFSPSAKGIKGQVVRYLHDPDELVIVADSFDAYLQMLMEEEYAFLNEESIEGMDI